MTAHTDASVPLGPDQFALCRPELDPALMAGDPGQHESLQSPFKLICLRQKAVLVTGGTSGIGYEIARYLGAPQTPSKRLNAA